jgi:hypothetical protein
LKDTEGKKGGDVENIYKHRMCSADYFTYLGFILTLGITNGTG